MKPTPNPTSASKSIKPEMAVRKNKATSCVPLTPMTCLSICCTVSTDENVLVVWLTP